MIKRSLVALVALAWALSACGGSDDPLREAVSSTRAQQKRCHQKLVAGAAGATGLAACLAENEGHTYRLVAKYQAKPITPGSCSDAGGALADGIERWYEYLTAPANAGYTTRYLDVLVQRYNSACHQPTE